MTLQLGIGQMSHHRLPLNRKCRDNQSLGRRYKGHQSPLPLDSTKIDIFQQLKLGVVIEIITHLVERPFDSHATARSPFSKKIESVRPLFPPRSRPHTRHITVGLTPDIVLFDTAGVKPAAEFHEGVPPLAFPNNWFARKGRKVEPVPCAQ